MHPGPLPANTPRSFRDQLDRVRRLRARLDFHNRPRPEYEDDLWSFFQNAWHLKDWLKNDPTVPASFATSLEGLIEGHDSLMIVADLANRTKHRSLNPHPARPGAALGGFDIRLAARPDLSYGPTYDDWVVVSPGVYRRALDVADEALAAWDQLLRAGGLV
jgi:hypothetical protein